MGSEWAAMILGVDTKKLLHFRRLKRLLKLVVGNKGTKVHFYIREKLARRKKGTKSPQHLKMSITGPKHKKG